MSMFIHSLTHVRTTRDDSTLDDYGQPTEGAIVLTPMKGLVQPQTAREQDDSRSAGAEIADHNIFIPLDVDVSSADAFLKDGERYEVLGVQRFEFGNLAHLKIGARRVSGAVLGTEGGS